MDWHPSLVDLPTPRLRGYKKHGCKGADQHHHEQELASEVWPRLRNGCRMNEAQTQHLWMRRKAPYVVERLPRTRSIPAFPSYEPGRDHHYFDEVNRRAAEARERKRTASQTLSPQALSPQALSPQARSPQRGRQAAPAGMLPAMASGAGGRRSASAHA